MASSSYPLVSIVIPSYNALPYLEEAIESVLAQDYPNIELIVINDGSTDATEEFLKKYQGQFYFETHTNRGQAETLNKGWNLSKGEILAYLSADDLLTPSAVSTSVKVLLNNPEIALTYADNLLINENSQPIRKLITKEFNLYSLYLESTTPVAVASFFRRTAFDAIGGWDKRYKQIGDYEYHIRLSQLGSFKRIPSILGYHRIHDNSASYRKMNFERANEYVELMTYVLKNTKDQKILQIKNKILSQAYLISGRTHWRSDRFSVGFKYFMKSLVLNPKAIYSSQTYRVILNALLSRKMYKLLKYIKSSSKKVA